MVRVEHVAKDGNYPYNLEMKALKDKLFDLYTEQVFEIIGIAGTAGTGIILIPLLGFGLGAGVMFLQGFVDIKTLGL